MSFSVTRLTDALEQSLMRERGNACFFTGHREIPGEVCAGVITLLEDEVESLVFQGFTVFYCGMARGFDLLAARAVWHQKKIHPSVRLICAIPCPDQTRNWSDGEKRVYELLCEQGECILLSDAYDKQCMRRRNCFMVDHASFGVCYYRASQNPRSGTGQTIRYAEQQNISYLNLSDML